MYMALDIGDRQISLTDVSNTVLVGIRNGTQMVSVPPDIYSSYILSSIFYDLDGGDAPFVAAPLIDADGGDSTTITGQDFDAGAAT